MLSMLPYPPPKSGPLPKSSNTRGHSCVLCRRRKVRCDGERPCQNCQRSQATCVAAEFAPPKGRKRKHEDLAQRLKRAEEALIRAGLKIEDDDNEYVDVGRGSESGNTSLMGTGTGSIGEERDGTIADGKLIIDKGQSRYVESRSVWGNMSTEVREDSAHLLQQSSEDDEISETSPVPDYSSLLFGRLMISNSLLSVHPLPVQIFQLWQVFLNNINPVIKILHAPTVQELLLQGMANLDIVPTSTECLMFAIYHIAIVSLDDQDCQSILGESRSSAIAKYSTATQQALINARFLRSSSLVVLQAFALYLLSIREATDHDTLWVLAGTANKLGRRLGLHQDSVSSALPALEAEMRRRLWWQILAIEGKSSFYSGSTDTFHRPPPLLNVNDSDLSPSMREPPVEQAAITEMLFCSISYEIASFMFDHILDGGSVTKATIYRTEKLASVLKATDDLECRLHQKYIRYCDLSVPLHYLSNIVVHGALSKVRLCFYTSPRGPGAAPQSQTERDTAFGLSLKLLELDDQVYSVEGKAKLKGFMWHVRQFFQLEAVVYALSELRVRILGPHVDHAWQLIESTYLRHDELSRATKNKLWFAVGNLCLKAWEQRVKGLRSQQVTKSWTMPVCVQKLYAQRGVKIELANATEYQELAGADFARSIGLPTQNGQSSGTQFGDMALPMLFDPAEVEGMDWDYWQALFNDSGAPHFT